MLLFVRFGRNKKIYTKAIIWNTGDYDLGNNSKYQASLLNKINTKSCENEVFSMKVKTFEVKINNVRENKKCS